jgi:hypothetical protein
MNRKPGLGRNAHDASRTSAAVGRKLQISTCVLPARLQRIAHVCSVYATFHTLSHGSLISRTYSNLPPITPPVAGPETEAEAGSGEDEEPEGAGEGEEDVSGWNSNSRTRPSFPPVTRKRESNWRPVTELSCAASRCTTENGFCVPAARAVRVCLDRVPGGESEDGCRSWRCEGWCGWKGEGVLLEDVSEDDEEEGDGEGEGENEGTGESAGGEECVGSIEKMMTRPSDPPVTSMLFESWT